MSGRPEYVVDIVKVDAPAPVEREMFGLAIVGTRCTVCAGEIHYGKTIVIMAKADQVITVDNTYLGVRMPWFGSIGTLIQSTTKPISNDTNFEKWLYLIRYDGTRCWMERDGRLAIDAPGAFAPNA
jgi:hypothetical protein